MISFLTGVQDLLIGFLMIQDPQILHPMGHMMILKLLIYPIQKNCMG